MNQTVTALVLAAGCSRRMPQANKLSLPLFNSTVLETSLSNLIASQVDEVVVVLGYEADRLRPLVDAFGARAIYNADWERGMAGSLQTGLRAVAAHSDAVLICLADMPFVSPQIINLLLNGFHQTDGSRIVAPFLSGRRGHPVLFPRRFFSHLHAIRPEDNGARQVLEEQASQLHRVDVNQEHIFADIDTPDGYAAALKKEAAT